MGTKVKAIKEAVSILAALQELGKVEKDLIVYFIDALANEYGWSIEYIRSLTLEEVAQFIHQIRNRIDSADIRTQLNHAKAFSGKISSNLKKPEKKNKETEHSNLQKLSRRLGVPVKKVKKDK